MSKKLNMNAIQVNADKCKDYTQELLRVDSSRVLVMSDVHVPYYHAGLMEKALKLAVAWDIKDLILSGDFLNGGAWSTHGGVDSEPWEHEVKAAQDLFVLFKKIFNRCYWMLGNHESRFLRETKYRGRFEDLARMVGADIDSGWCTITENDYLILNKHNYLIHPHRSYSNSPLTTANKIHGIHQNDVFIAHEHHQAISTSPNGKHIIANLGTMIDDRMTGYKQRSKNQFREWTKGITVFVDDYPYQLFETDDSPRITNWDYWMKHKP